VLSTGWEWRISWASGLHHVRVGEVVARQGHCLRAHCGEDLGRGTLADGLEKEAPNGPQHSTEHRPHVTGEIRIDYAGVDRVGGLLSAGEAPL